MCAAFSLLARRCWAWRRKVSPLYDYRCSQGHVTEAKRKVVTQAILCPACRRPAQRVPTYENQYIIGATVAKYRRRDVRAPEEHSQDYNTVSRT